MIFLSIASIKEPFLLQFQSSWSLAPFLYEELNILLSNVMEWVIKKNSGQNYHQSGDW